MQQSHTDARVAQHSGIQANSMGIDALGRYCILGTRRNLIVIDLTQPDEIKRRITRQSNWDVSQIQWNPCPNKKEYFATAYSQTADVWTYDDNNASQIATLKGHTRNISDIDWSPSDENLIASCSIDTLINVWDIRDTKRPTMTPSAVAGAYQVKWNKQTQYILATAHDGDVRIWDIRNGRTPTQYITAHLSKIHSLDWSYRDPNILASSGQDTTVRFWDTSQPSVEADDQISAGAPVRTARYTPFGYGMITTLMPQMQRWDNSALLWNVRNTSKPVHTYAGHRDAILDFGWRYIAGERTAELVTWSKDHSLLMWKCDSSLLTSCGCGTSVDEDELSEDGLYDDFASGDQGTGANMAHDVPQVSAAVGFESSGRKGGYGKQMPPHSTSATPNRPGDLYASSPNTRSSSPNFDRSGPSPGGKLSTPPGSLERELSTINMEWRNLIIEEISVDPQHRSCVVIAYTHYIVVRLRLRFPPHYPNNSPPSFHIEKPTNLRPKSAINLVRLLHEKALNQVRNNLPCVEVCLRLLLQHVENMLHSDMVPQESYTPPYSGGMYGTYQQLVKIPFPRTSGARFCGAGQLVTFMRPTQVKGFEASAEPTTPRCLVALLDLRQENVMRKGPPSMAHMKAGLQYGASPDELDISVKDFYYKQKKPRKIKHASKDGSRGNAAISSEELQIRLHKAAGKVVIQDLSSSLTMNRTLASEYVVPTKSNYLEACDRNRDIAERVGRKDLVELWTTLKLIQSSVLNDKASYGKPWAVMGFGKPLVTRLIAHYSKLHDVQTLAMISCMFASDHSPKPGRNGHHWHPDMARSPSYNSIENDSGSGSYRSNSFCENPSDLNFSRTGQSPQSLYLSNIESPTDDYRFVSSPIMDSDSRDDDWQDRSIGLLDRSHQSQYDAFKLAYANILDRWKLINHKVEILKYRQQLPAPHSGLTFRFVCQHCQDDTQFLRCTSCMKFAMSCALCRLPVKALLNFCLSCGHGGHLDHMESWFETETSCATGCGCECRRARGSALTPDY